MSEQKLFEKIAVCDDEEKSLEVIKRYAEYYFAQYGVEFSLHTYSSAEELLREAVQSPYDICFLDIDMPDRNGIDLAEQINRGDNQTLIVFVSFREDYVFQSFRAHPFSFVRKSHFQEDMDRTIRDVVKLRTRQRDQNELCRIVDEAGYEHVFLRDSICYLKAEEKYVDVVLTDGKKLLRCSMKNLERELAPYGMIRCHKSYIVNIRKVYAVKYDHLMMLDKTQIPIRRGMVGELKKQLCSVLVQ